MNPYVYPGIVVDGNKIPTNHHPIIGDIMITETGRTVVATSLQLIEVLVNGGSRVCLKMSQIANIKNGKS